MLKPFRAKKIVPSKLGPNMAAFGKIGAKTLDIILVSRSPKGTYLRGTASFNVFCVNIGARVSAVAFLKKKSSRDILCRGGA